MRTEITMHPAKDVVNEMEFFSSKAEERGNNVLRLILRAMLYDMYKNLLPNLSVTAKIVCRNNLLEDPASLEGVVENYWFIARTLKDSVSVNDLPLDMLTSDIFVLLASVVLCDSYNFVKWDSLTGEQKRYVLEKLTETYSNPFKVANS